jgi:hypothetical protein
MLQQDPKAGKEQRLPGGAYTAGHNYRDEGSTYAGRQPTRLYFRCQRFLLPEWWWMCFNKSAPHATALPELQVTL